MSVTQISLPSRSTLGESSLPKLEPNRVTNMCALVRFVYTDMGVTAAKAAGIDLPATSAEESASKIIELIDSAKKETVSGKFIDVITGDEMPW
jgi:hypothetical protein